MQGKISHIEVTLSAGHLNLTFSWITYTHDKIFGIFYLSLVAKLVATYYSTERNRNGTPVP